MILLRVEELQQLPVQPVLPPLRAEPGDVRSERGDPGPALPAPGCPAQPGCPQSVVRSLTRSHPRLSPAQHSQPAGRGKGLQTQASLQPAPGQGFPVFHHGVRLCWRQSSRRPAGTVLYQSVTTGHLLLVSNAFMKYFCFR